MHLGPKEQERVLIFNIAQLARRRLDRGAQIGATEAVALLCDEICELAWDGWSLDSLIDEARKVVPANQLLPGVAEATPVLEIEALFPHGTSLVHVPWPFGEPDSQGVGAVMTAPGDRDLATGRQRLVAELYNSGGLPIWLSSHVRLGEVNPAIEVTPVGLDGYRLDLPAGDAIVIQPAERVEVTAVPSAEGT